MMSIQNYTGMDCLLPFGLDIAACIYKGTESIA